MPGEWERHACCHMIVPHSGSGNWSFDAKPGRAAHAEMAKAIAAFEPVMMWTNQETWTETKATLGAVPNITLKMMESDDCWVRDSGPTFLVKQDGMDTNNKPLLGGICWKFNAWGGLYKPIHDAEVAETILVDANVETIFHTPGFILEGGSIHSDGEGTILTTEECLLNPNRNPTLSKNQIEQYLLDYTGAKKVIWLRNGLTGDHDTNGHVDNFCTFVKPGHVLLAWCDDPTDPQYAISREAYDLLIKSEDAKGRKLMVSKMILPPPMYYTEEYCASLKDGVREGQQGQRMAASYINFYVANGGIIAPSFQAPSTDAQAKRILEQCYPDRTVVMVDSTELIVGGGNIHCMTQQQPDVISF